MTRPEITQRLAEIFRDIFEDSSLILRDDMTAKDVEKWDSLTHIDMIVLVEDSFKIKITTKEVAGLKNVGELIAVIEKRISR